MTQHIADAVARVHTVLTRRPDMGVHDDSPAHARWQGGMRCVATHANGFATETDMATEVGGTGDRVTPGWLFRAGVASCATTTIAMHAAVEGIQLSVLEATVESRTDMRGFLGMSDRDGNRIHPGPRAMWLRVRIAAEDVPPEQLKALVERSCRCSPIPSAVAGATPLELSVELA
jgi:uncharacterized OsmC-like protein